MKIATWNVNSVRSRLPRLLAWLEERSPDVVCLQETKVVDELFPREALEALGYHCEAFGQKAYNGVAILARLPIEKPVRGFPEDGEETEKRVLGACIGGVQVLDLYVVNGKEVGSDKYAYKLAWLERLHSFIPETFDLNRPLLVTGDFNITFDDRDVHDPEKWRGRILCSEPERRALQKLCGLGLHDALRKFTEEKGHFTWWDFRTRAYSGDRGLRIDHFLLSKPALDACRSIEVDRKAREGEKPSDHAPVLVELDLG